ncbi:hypothetical protein V1512DRAFT_195226, partial [Lipomyces arxii]|uniref:uncharacterized protein n=1 Tax=Lipomyces arxii TaxID=56418 RepID=UPI0034CF3B9D
SKHSELSDFRQLLRVLEHNHKAELVSHLIVATRLHSRDLQSKASGETKLIVPKHWTTWPINLQDLARDSKKFDLGVYDPIETDDREEFYETYRLPTSKLVAFPPYSHRLLGEVSGAAIRALHPRFIHRSILTNDELEHSILFPHVHSSIMKFIDKLMDSLILLRINLATEKTKARVTPFSWKELLNVASIIGIPELEHNWLNVVEDVRIQCEGFF